MGQRQVLHNSQAVRPATARRVALSAFEPSPQGARMQRWPEMEGAGLAEDQAQMAPHAARRERSPLPAVPLRVGAAAACCMWGLDLLLRLHAVAGWSRAHCLGQCHILQLGVTFAQLISWGPGRLLSCLAQTLPKHLTSARRATLL